MKFVGAACLMAVAAVSSAQVPDVRVKFDITLSLLTTADDKTTFKPYDLLGRHSTVSLIFFLEPGFRAFVSQKIQPFPNETDGQPFDEYYVEDEGIWRVGKQYLPFGTGLIMRESVLAARADTGQIVAQFPLSVALCDGGSGYQRGVVARLGNRVGVSVAYGRHFGIASTALTLVRHPEDSPGKDRGWRLALGADYTRRLDKFTIRAEGLTLRSGETVDDRDLTLGDLALTFTPNRSQSYTLGYTQVLPNDGDLIRAMGSFKLTDTVNFEPIFRYRDGNFYDASLEFRVKF